MNCIWPQCSQQTKATSVCSVNQSSLIIVLPRNPSFLHESQHTTMSDSLLYSTPSRLYQTSIVIPLNSKKINKMQMTKHFVVMQNSPRQDLENSARFVPLVEKARLQTTDTTAEVLQLSSWSPVMTQWRKNVSLEPGPGEATWCDLFPLTYE